MIKTEKVQNLFNNSDVECIRFFEINHLISKQP